jgi:hypothetical protein
VEVDRDIELPAPERPRKRQILADPPEAGYTRRNDHFVEMRVVSDDRCPVLFDDVCEARVRIRAPERTDERCGEGNVPDQTQPQDQDRTGCER